MFPLVVGRRAPQCLVHWRKTNLQTLVTLCKNRQDKFSCRQFLLILAQSVQPHAPTSTQDAKLAIETLSCQVRALRPRASKTQ